jgi:hypothetical protein
MQADAPWGLVSKGAKMRENGAGFCKEAPPFPVGA